MTQEQHQQTVQQWWQMADEATPEPGWTRLYHDKDTHMDFDDLYPSKYLKQSDIGDKEVTVTIEWVKKVNMARDDQKPEYKPIIKFAEFEKPMVMNKTNAKRIRDSYGKEIDQWPDKKMVIYVNPDVVYGDETTGGLRLKTKPNSKPNTKPSHPTDEDVNRKLREAQSIDDDIPF